MALSQCSLSKFRLEVASVSTQSLFADSREYHLAMTGLGLLLYLMVALLFTKGSFDFLENGRAAYRVGVFSDMTLSLLRGSLAADPAIIGNEGFLVNGRITAYWGVWPAVFRVPFSLFYNLADYDLTRLSAACAVSLGLAFKVVALRDAHAHASGKDAGPLVCLTLFAILFSGVGVTLSTRLGVWFEIALWGYAFSVIFVTLLLRVLENPVKEAQLAFLMAAVAGLCLNTRASTGAGLFLALSVACLLFCKPGLRRRIPTIWGGVFFTTLPFVALYLIMNYLRWGSPLNSLDMSASPLYKYQHWNLEAYGLFNAERFPESMNYYFLPVWGYLDQIFGTSRAALVNDLFYALEPPYASFFLTDAFWIILAGTGLASLLSRRGRLPLAYSLMLLLALCFPILVISGFYFQAHRYRVEFVPLLYFLAFFGLSRLAASPDRQKDRMLAGAVAVQSIATALLASLAQMDVQGRGPEYISRGYLLFLYDKVSP